MTVEARGWMWLGALATMTAGAVLFAVYVPPIG